MTPITTPAAGIVGRVIGTEDSTPLEFWVAVAPGVHLQLDDVVALERTLPDGQSVAIYGIVGQVRARHEGARFQSDVFLVADGVLPAEVSEAAMVQPTRFVPEWFVPPLPGTPVYRATDAERDRALDFEDVERRLPAGTSADGEPIWLDLDFVDGTKGAHVNISGISGVATKTSYATFLLYGLFRSGVLGAEATNTKAVIFNVKGEDLLFLDRANTALTPEDAVRYEGLGLAPAGPFPDVGILAPPRRGDPSATPHTGARTTEVAPLLWTVHDFCRQRLFPFLFADAEDERQQYTIVVQAVTARLEEAARQDTANDGAVAVEGKRVRTFEQLVEALIDVLAPEGDDPDPRWTGRSIGGGTIHAFIRRLSSAVPHLGHLIRADIADVTQHRLNLDAHQVTVVDLHMLHDRAKRFVVGVILRGAFDTKEQSGLARPLQLIVLDELNKYAPRDGSSPIKEVILDVAERGRSMGIVLIGAQQTASEVERRVVANSAIRVVGRLDAAEARRDEYGFLPQVQRQRATILKPGSMYVSQPRLSVPLLVEFPFPAWATRSAEAAPPPGLVGDDAFDGL